MTRSRLLWPAGGILLLLALYSAYWVFASFQLRRSVEDWIAAQESAGYTIEYDRLKIGGYPYRFQVRFDAPRIRAPQSDGGWYAHFASSRANALPYDLSHWILDIGGPVFLEDYTEPGGMIELNAEDARISLVYNRQGGTERVGAEVRALDIVTHAGQAPDVRSVDLMLLSGLVEDDDRLRLRLETQGVTAAPGVLEPDIARTFGETASMARIDLEVTQWSTLARGANALAWRDAGGVLHIAESELEWGPARLSGSGDFTIDSLSRPDGRLSLRVADPDSLADALVESGMVPRENEQALRLAAMLAPRGPEGVSLPFRIHDGAIYLGPVRLGSIDN